MGIRKAAGKDQGWDASGRVGVAAENKEMQEFDS